MVSLTMSMFASRPQSSNNLETAETEKAANMDRRFSLLFTGGTSAQPQLTAPPAAQEAAQQQKDDVPPPERKTSPPNASASSQDTPTRIKMDRRFSTLLSLPALSTPPQSQHGEKHVALSTKSSKKTIHTLLRRVFSLSSAPTSMPLSRPATSGEAIPIPTPEDLGSRLWADLLDSSPSLAATSPPTRSNTQTVQRSHTVIVPAPASSLKLQSRSRFSQALRGGGGKKKNGGNENREPEVVGILQSREAREGKRFGGSRADSKFSSITSLPSLRSLALPTRDCSSSNGTITVSATSLMLLESCIRKVRRGLKHQEYLTSHLSNNLVFLFSRKEKQIAMLKRLRSEDKTSLTSALVRIKESTGRTFLRKAVFLQRSQELVAQLSALLSRSKPSPSEDPEAEAEITAESGMLEVEDNIFDLLALLKEDLKTQRELDRHLHDTLLEAAREKKWAGSPGERSLMRKFVGFVEGRMGALGTTYGKLEGLVGRMEGVERGA